MNNNSDINIIKDKKGNVVGVLRYHRNRGIQSHPFVSGLSSLFDFSGNYTNLLRMLGRDDASVIGSDWENVGVAIANAMAK